MQNPSICIITNCGQNFSGPVIQPFFRTILPALRDKADEIRVVATATDVFAEFVSNGKTVALKLHAEFQPFVASSRIRIASGMSIMPTELQTGSMQMIFEQHRALVSVEITRSTNTETLTMKLRWN